MDIERYVSMGRQPPLVEAQSIIRETPYAAANAIQLTSSKSRVTIIAEPSRATRISGESRPSSLF
jgi:hypothetical protein